MSICNIWIVMFQILAIFIVLLVFFGMFLIDLRSVCLSCCIFESRCVSDDFMRNYVGLLCIVSENS